MTVVHEAIADDEALAIAETAGLRYVTDARPGIRRRRCGRGFSYRRVDGSPLTDERVLDRIRTLAIPPAWTDVWICPRPTATFRPPAATREAASSTATTRSGARSGTPPSTTG